MIIIILFSNANSKPMSYVSAVSIEILCQLWKFALSLCGVLWKSLIPLIKLVCTCTHQTFVYLLEISILSSNQDRIHIDRISCSQASTCIKKQLNSVYYEEYTVLSYRASVSKSTYTVGIIFAEDCLPIQIFQRLLFANPRVPPPLCYPQSTALAYIFDFCFNSRKLTGFDFVNLSLDNFG